MAVKPIPEGYHSVTPFLAVQGAAQLIDFLEKVFDAKVIERQMRPDGTVWHGEVKIGDSIVMVGDAAEPWKPMPTGLYVYVEDTDRTYRRALQAGATSVLEPVDQFYGDRNAGVKDACGNLWWIATHQEDVSPEEMARRAEEASRAQQTRG